ncbi:MAG TPA: 50S ribosomal protein L6 [Candidatus Lambdaproteobacteria bacterium]|jgi:large subunit ribosomal protein L6|nr:50S ribosomal protein L6 [SAR324 cluster bacterium]HHZ77847.1 50S ribosomal protein L6 [Candidatus Lambdaproteobacteria bacterium]HIB44818.1 50S ribosomal protein L6 [Candidatus Lambdaproteobacteria bacterium]HIB93031.1 50S ribosomal protein L6 [Candidatus Lambdaproteobacteria bacterium]HIO83923.1 50S ribosomal protein L6 [Deltaproteobacteria bacterium]
MSRIGKKPIKVTQGVEVSFKARLLSVKGPKGELELKAHPAIELNIDTEKILVTPADLDAPMTPMLGTTWALISNMIHGVTEGFQKQLNLVGVGYKAAVSQKILELNVGYSHPIKYALPDGIKATVNANTRILLESSDKQLLGQVSAEIQKFRPPEPYKGKGILFEGEKIKRKAGKSGKT